MRILLGKLSHEDVKSNDEAAGFATVIESSIGKKEIIRGNDINEYINNDMKIQNTVQDSTQFLISYLAEWKDDDLIAQAFLFFIAGFETISSSMSFLMYELAVNPDVQKRLTQEIREHDSKTGGKFDFNSIQSMTYMDMVVSGEILFIYSLTWSNKI